MSIPSLGPAPQPSLPPQDSGDSQPAREDADDLYQLQITTTDTIYGWIVTDYRGLVTSHIVAGTGFFSDFAAGWTDVFGGRSHTYQRQLAAIQEEALDALRHAAIEKGANWVIGSRIDFDEISGKGMQMFMVSAQGTAVRAIADPSAPQYGQTTTAISGSTVAERLRRDWVLARLPSIESGERLITEEFLEALCDTRTPQAIPLCLRLLVTPTPAQPLSEKMLKFARQALRMAPRRATRVAVQDLMLRKPSELLVNLYRDLGLLDLNWVLKQIQSADGNARRVGLQALCCCVAATYSGDDIPILRSLANAIHTGFPETCTQVEVKGLLGGKAVPKWRCQNGHDNSLESSRCDTCDVDRHGLPRDYSVAKALRVVESTRETLEHQFGHKRPALSS